MQRYVKLNIEYKMQHLSCNWLIIIKMSVAQKKNVSQNFVICKKSTNFAHEKI